MFKRTIIASAVLLATSTAWAASTGNQATVNQAQSGNTATINQVVGSVDNKANIDQAGNNNTAVTTQKNTGQSDADTRQVGDSNKGYILQ
ncbi:hypothetical protein ACEUB2_17825 [Aeromonas veronii]